ncbi:YcaO-like family protein [Priestia aryabhattai]|uniref:YcaO-like family protein n=1 Tax=Priestia aryabhattai TaxID=412384 RepID=UPI002E1FCAA5|nr:YcaO-like family protein [Priestia aryabhattai]
MIFQNKKGVRYGYTNKLFISDKGYNSISMLGVLKNSNGEIGPVNCGGISEDKNLSLLKAFSESLERRALVYGAKNVDNTSYSLAYDLISQSVAQIDVKYTKFSIQPPFVDTTGTATHPVPERAIFNAVSELIEKNSIFLFWYGKIGKKINGSSQSFYSDYLIKQGYKLNYFLIDYFFPFKVVITIAFSEKNPIKFKFGIGSGLDLCSAIYKSLSEAYLLGSYYEVLYHNNQKGFLSEDDQKEFSKFQSTDVLDYLYNLLNNSDEINNDDINFLNEENIYQCLPKWIKNLLITILPQSLKKELVVVKAFSPQLFNHVPKKSYLDLDAEINLSTIKLRQKDLNTIPDCPII